ncbi:MAG: cytochrome c-type biogenesis CcmF C-terminal domain-containing protein, partial [Nitrospinota bacterium]|nr:cytochrome c-type biogenesis CcmF C-terminal domain-containing protein [Nitrospinota bacterium]
PVIAWRRATWSNLKKNFTKPVIAAAVAAAGLWPVVPLTSRSEIYSYVAFILCVFVMSSVVIEFLKGARARSELHQEIFREALASLIWRNKRRYGGYIVHIGVVLIFAGIAGSQSYSVHKEKHLAIGETLEIRDYTFKYEKLVAIEATNVKTRVIARLGVFKDGKRVWTAHPEKEFYKGQNQPVSEVDVRSNFIQDIYVILADFNEDESATFKVYLNPMVSWLWTGGWIIALGAVVAVWPDRLEQRRRIGRMKKQETVFAPAQE